MLWVAHTHPASLWQRLTPKIRSITLYERSIIFSRFILIAFNLLLIVLILKPAQLPTPLVEIYLPLSLLVYAVVCLFGPRFLGYRPHPFWTDLSGYHLSLPGLLLPGLSLVWRRLRNLFCRNCSKCLLRELPFQY